MSHLLLFGITLGLLSRTVIGFIRFLANPFTVRAMDQWVIGGMEVTAWNEVVPVLLFLIPASRFFPFARVISARSNPAKN